MGQLGAPPLAARSGAVAIDVIDQGGTVGELSGKVAVVTGASRGIGAFIAARLAGAGASVAVTARTAQEGDHPFDGSLATVVAGSADAGGVAVPIVANLGLPQDRRRVIHTAQHELGPIDILVSNAAVTY